MGGNTKKGNKLICTEGLTFGEAVLKFKKILSGLVKDVDYMKKQIEDLTETVNKIKKRDFEMKR